MTSSSIILKKPGKVYSPLRYPGGKALLSSFFFDVIDSNKIVDCVYAEPFAGGAGAALTLLMWEKLESIIINDYDKAIFSFWNSAVNNSAEFLEKLRDTEATVEEWLQQFAIYNNPSSSELDLGFSAFFLNRTNRSGIIDGRPIGGKSQNGIWKIDARFNKEALSERIKKISMYRSRIDVRRLDGIQLMHDIYKTPNLLVYIDPPYYDKGSSLYLNYYQAEDHSSLSRFLNSNPDFHWILTYDNVPEIISLYPDRQKFSFSLYYHTGSPKLGKEILIKSDTINFSEQLSLDLSIG
jgi:DNA adenine methylase